MPMNNLFYLLHNWVCTVIKCKNNCSVYYKNEKIFSCKNCEIAEKHIKRIYDSVSHRLFSSDYSHNLNSVSSEEKNDWRKFRNSFKVDNE